MAVVLKHKVNVERGGVMVGTFSGVYSRRGVYGACDCMSTQHTNAGGASRAPAHAAAVEGQLQGAAGPSGAAGAPGPCRAAFNVNQESIIIQ